MGTVYDTDKVNYKYVDYKLWHTLKWMLLTIWTIKMYLNFFDASVQLIYIIDNF